MNTKSIAVMCLVCGVTLSQATKLNQSFAEGFKEHEGFNDTLKMKGNTLESFKYINTDQEWENDSPAVRGEKQW